MTRCVYHHFLPWAQPSGRLRRDFLREQEMGSEGAQNSSQNSGGDVRGKPQQRDFTMNWLLLLSGQTEQCPYTVYRQTVNYTALSRSLKLRRCPMLTSNYKLKLTQNCISFFPFQANRPRCTSSQLKMKRMCQSKLMHQHSNVLLSVLVSPIY